MSPVFVYTGIRVRDIDRSLKFYTEVLGLKLKSRIAIPGTGGEVVELADETGNELELNYYPEGSKFHREYAAGEELDHLAFKVADAAKFIAYAESKGYPVKLKVESESSSWSYIVDPDGIYIEIIE